MACACELAGGALDRRARTGTSAVGNQSVVEVDDADVLDQSYTAVVVSTTSTAVPIGCRRARSSPVMRAG